MHACPPPHDGTCSSIRLTIFPPPGPSLCLTLPPPDRRYLLSITCAVAIGRIGAPELAASSLANSIYIVTGMSLVMGLSSAMEPLCGQVGWVFTLL